MARYMSDVPPKSRIFFKGDSSLMEEDIRHAVERFGYIEELKVFKGPGAGSGFVKFARTSEACACLDELNNHTLPGYPKSLKVNICHTPDEVKLGLNRRDQEFMKRIFIQIRQGNDSEQTLRDVFTEFGEISHVTMKPKTAIVNFRRAVEAARAIEGSDSRFAACFVDPIRLDPDLMRKAQEMGIKSTGGRPYFQQGPPFADSGNFNGPINHPYGHPPSGMIMNAPGNGPPFGPPQGMGMGMGPNNGPPGNFINGFDGPPGFNGPQPTFGGGGVPPIGPFGPQSIGNGPAFMGPSGPMGPMGPMTGPPPGYNGPGPAMQMPTSSTEANNIQPGGVGILEQSVNMSNNPAESVELYIFVPSCLTQQQVFRLCDLVPGLDSVDLKPEPPTNNRAIAFITYTSGVAASWALEKFNDFEYPVGQHVKVVLASDGYPKQWESIFPSPVSTNKPTAPAATPIRPPWSTASQHPPPSVNTEDDIQQVSHTAVISKYGGVYDTMKRNGSDLVQQQSSSSSMVRNMEKLENKDDGFEERLKALLGQATEGNDPLNTFKAFISNRTDDVSGGIKEDHSRRGATSTSTTSLRITPPELEFNPPYNRLQEHVVRLGNTSSRDIRYIIRGTQPSLYKVANSIGKITVNGTVDVTIYLFPFKYNQKRELDHEFCVESVNSTFVGLPKDDLDDLFEADQLDVPIGMTDYFKVKINPPLMTSSKEDTFFAGHELERKREMVDMNAVKNMKTFPSTTPPL